MQFHKLDLEFTNGTHSIAGKNRAGKSSIYESIAWGVTGVTARGDKSVTRRGSKFGTVQVFGDKDGVLFTIERVEGKSLKFWVRDELVEMGTIPLNQKRINEFLGVNPTTFSGCTLYGHCSFRLTRAGDSARKELIEELVDLNRFHDAREKVTEEWNICIRGHRDNVNEIDILDGKCTSLKEESEQKTQKDITEIKASIKTRLAVLSELKKQLPKVVPQRSKDVNAAMVSCVHQRQRAVELQKKMAEMDVCPTCGQKMSEKRMIEINEVSMKECEGYDKQYAILAKELVESEKYEDLKNDIVAIELYIRNDEEELAGIESGDTDLQRHITEQVIGMSKQMAKLRKTNAALDKRIRVLEFWKKAYSRSGVMALLMDSVIEQLNVYALEASAGITDGLLAVQLSSTTTAKSGNVQDKISLEILNGGEIVPYTSLSNSEAQRIDMIMMFAWQRLMQDYAGISVDVAFFDEIFEGLDSDSMESVLNYIVSTRGKLPTYIISHIPDAAFAPASVIRVTRDKEGSHIEEE